MTPCFPVPPTVAFVCRVPCVMCRSPAAALLLCGRVRRKARHPRRTGHRSEMPPLQALLGLRSPPCLRRNRLWGWPLRQKMAAMARRQARRRYVSSLSSPAIDAVRACTLR